MSVVWACQSNLGNSDDISIIENVCIRNEYDFVPIKVIPFCDEIDLLCLPNDKPIIFYGSVRFVDIANSCCEFKDGIFLNKSSVCSIWSLKYGTYCLNYPNVRTTFGDELLKDYVEIFRNEGKVFVRPDADNKAFNGQLFRVEDIDKWVDNLSGDRNSLLFEPIIISSPVDIYKEYRLFILDGKVIGGSQYKKYGVLNRNNYVPDSVISFAEKMSEIYSPKSVFVMDIAEIMSVMDGESHSYFVIEVGSFNSSGFYFSDIENIVLKVSDKVLKNYEKH
jgi:hypothetical protein